MSDTADEIWKDIKGYEGHYWVSNLGNVKSKYRDLKLSSPRSGQYRIALSNLGAVMRYSVHRLVAEAFVEKPVGKDVVDHIDRNPANNRASNLRWVTQRENCWNRTDKENSTGFKYVSRTGNRYHAVITRNIGSYDTPEEAHNAALEYLKNEDSYYKKYSHLKTSSE